MNFVARLLRALGAAITLLIGTAARSWKFLLFMSAFAAFDVLYRWAYGLEIRPLYHVGFVVLPFVLCVLSVWLLGIASTALSHKDVWRDLTSSPDTRRAALNLLEQSGRFVVF